MDVAMFLWDQYIIGLDTPGFNERFLPMVTATFLMLLHSSIVTTPQVRRNSQLCRRLSLVNCTGMHYFHVQSQPLGIVLKKEGPKLTVPHFQYEVSFTLFNHIPRFFHNFVS